MTTSRDIARERRDTLQVNVLARWNSSSGSFHRTTPTTALTARGRKRRPSTGFEHGPVARDAPFGGYNASKAALSIWAKVSIWRRVAQLDAGSPSRSSSPACSPRNDEGDRPRAIPAGAPSRVAATIVHGALAGRSAIRPPFWFALLTWAICLAGRDVRYRILARARPRESR